MLSSDLLIDAFDRVSGVVHSVLKDAGPGLLGYRPDPEANTIAWLVWHLARIQDAQVAPLIGEEQVWTADGWSVRFALPFGPSATGYGHTADEVAAVRSSAELLGGYFDAVHSRTIAYLPTLVETDFVRVVDRAWNPPVTLAVRLVSIIADDLQHAGQAAYVRGLALRAEL
ncbi:mycothiol transferase [Cryobacterium tagatosivorans]|uniref:DUF664 domain-containing protein n=1 Tax=Cryobacterium tagatosivorans TaxID=1259199 RepID=A0A4R8UBJ2_9MICO|nr:DUF664 domain-containing protein [Cryobacterium tagatosivorans]TFB46997.1 DUF664 domain-containing protein [Cryobacterium tagatosivorans]